jgi:membrane associated rhomboid family serine protease
VPFLRFALPFGRPTRWDIVVLSLIVVIAHALRVGLDIDTLRGGAFTASAIPAAPWRLVSFALVHASWGHAIGNAAGLMIAGSMASRAGGTRLAFGGVLGASLIAGLLLWWRLPSGVVFAGSSPALFAALGMGATSWFRLREELTYARRADRMAGAATIGLVLLAVAWPILRNDVPQLIHWIGLGWGALLAAVVPRTWERDD